MMQCDSKKKKLKLVETKKKNIKTLKVLVNVWVSEEEVHL